MIFRALSRRRKTPCSILLVIEESIGRSFRSDMGFLLLGRFVEATWRTASGVRTSTTGKSFAVFFHRLCVAPLKLLEFLARLRKCSDETYSLRLLFCFLIFCHRYCLLTIRVRELWNFPTILGCPDKTPFAMPVRR